MAEDFERIRRNVQKMLSMSAPETDIDEYLTSERLTPTEFKIIATGKSSLGSIRMTQKSQGEIAKTLSRGQTMPAEGVERSTILPFSKATATGETFFDPEAGLFGAVKRGVMTPGDVAMGKLDPNSPEGARRMAEFATVASPVSAGAARGVSMIPGISKTMRPIVPRAPTAEALGQAADVGYETVRKMGVDYSAQAVKGLADDIEQRLIRDGRLEEQAKGTYGLLRKLQRVPVSPEDGTTLTTLDQMVSARRALQNIAGDYTNPQDQAAAGIAIKSLDEFLEAANPESVVAGPATAAAKELERARGNVAAEFRSKRITKPEEGTAITGAEQRAEINAAVANSGMNLGNQLRQQIRRIVTDPKQARGYSKEEIKLMTEIASGRLGINVMRRLGNFLGGGGGLTAQTAGLGTAAIGLQLGGPLGLMAGIIPPAIGAGARATSNAMTKRQIRLLDELIRRRSPLYQEALRNAPLRPQYRLNPAANAAVQRGLMFMRPREQR